MVAQEETEYKEEPICGLVFEWCFWWDNAEKREETMKGAW